MVLAICMGSKIPESSRWAIIEKWMLGLPRNTIAIECGVSNGAVSSVVDDWRHSVGLELSVLIRDIGITLRKLGMSPSQCATGLRLLRIVERIGLDENSVESFLSTVLEKCQASDINPNHIARYIEGLTSLLEETTGGNELISIQHIDRLFETRRQRNFELQEEKRRLESEIDRLRMEASHYQRIIGDLRQGKDALEADLNWKSELRSELKKYGLRTDNIPKLVDAARFFDEKRFNIEEMLMKFSNYKGMDDAISWQEQHLESLKQKSRNLEQMTQFQDKLLEERKLKNSELDTLKEMGFELGALKALRNLVTEAFVENELITENGNAVKLFISDVENNYDDYLRLPRKVNQLRDQLSNLRSSLGATRNLGVAITAFLQRGPTSDDISEVVSILRRYPKDTP